MKDIKAMLKEKEALVKEVEAIDKKMKKLREERSEYQKRIYRLEKFTTPVQITDHALVRYLERVTGIDLEMIREDILSGRKEFLMGRKGRVTLGNGYTVVIENNKVITIYKS